MFVETTIPGLLFGAEKIRAVENYLQSLEDALEVNDRKLQDLHTKRQGLEVELQVTAACGIDMAVALKKARRQARKLGLQVRSALVMTREELATDYKCLIRWVQWALNVHNSRLALRPARILVVDGIFGARTSWELRHFQTFLVVDGKMGGPAAITGQINKTTIEALEQLTGSTAPRATVAQTPGCVSGTGLDSST
jgi:hypothetical protein